MNIIKTVIWSATLCIASIPAAAETLCLRVDFADGDNCLVALDELTRWEIDGTTLSIHPLQQESPLSYTLSDAAKITHVNAEPGGANQPDTDTTKFNVTAEGLSISGAPSVSRCTVYDINGAKVIDRAFNHSLTIGHLPKGVYVATLNGKKLVKFQVK